MEDFIKLEKISKIYKNDFHALKDITLNIKKGEVFALLGPNGAGKSTLINVICGLAHQTTGEIYVDNFNIKNNRKLIKSKIGLVPQELHLEFLWPSWSVFMCFFKYPDVEKDFPQESHL